MVMLNGNMEYVKSIPGALPAKICGWNQSRLMLDHCHRHTWIRGWLCGKCNQEIRTFENRGTGTGPTWRRIFKWNADLRVKDFITHVNKCPDCIWKALDLCKACRRCTLGLFGWF